MADAIPTIRKHITICPHTIAEDAMLSVAQGVMRSREIRHLPVVRDGRLVGLLSDRDIAVIEALEGVDPRAVPVRIAMHTNVYTASPDAPLDEVLIEMAERKVGSCVVVLGAEVVGILTTVDVCRGFVRHLQGRGS
jgi:acetoin utilization protein AcuB